MMGRILSLAVLVALICAAPTPAHAGGVLLGIGSWLGGIGSAIAATSVWTWLTTNFWGRLVSSLVISSLQARLARRKQVVPGMRSTVPGTGGLNPRSFILGTFVTAGTRMMPDNAFGTAASPNYWLTQVLDLSDITGATWRRAALDGAWMTLDTVTPAIWAGQTFTGKYAGHAYIRFRTGTETTADAWLLAQYGTDPQRPWTADMIGTGIVQAILHFGYRTDIWNARPQLRHEVDGNPLYDPRADSTAGGSGAQRWTDRATWTFSQNPMVELYNVMRGITLDSLGTWGGKIDGADLPFASWAAAMAKCDVLYPKVGGGTEPRFTAGLEVKVTDEPHEIAAALLDAASADIADCGGTWKVRVAEPGLPVYFFTDADTLATQPEQLDPFPASDGIKNGIRTIYTEPSRVYEPVDGPNFTNAAWVAEDGEEKIAELQLPAVTSRGQVARIASAELKVQRTGMVQHRVPLPPDALILEPLDTVAWTSQRHGYVAKLFEVIEIEDQPETAIIIATIRAVDPDDHIAPGLPSAMSAFAPAPPVTPFALTGIALTTAIATTGAARRRVLKVTWPPAELAGKGLEYEVRRQGETTLLCSGAVLDATLGEATVPAEPLPGVTYEARVRLSSLSPQTWSAWTSVAVPQRRTVGSADLVALGTAKTVTNALTAFDPVASVSVTDTAFTGQEGGFAKMQVSLTGAASAKLVWRLIARQTPSGGSYTIFERIEELTSGRTLILSGGGSVAAPWTAFDVAIEVSGELMPAGATATITHRAIQFITPHA